METEETIEGQNAPIEEARSVPDGANPIVSQLASIYDALMAVETYFDCLEAEGAGEAVETPELTANLARQMLQKAMAELRVLKNTLE